MVDIKSPSSSQLKDSVELGGEPASVAVKDRLALVAVNTSSNFTELSGSLVVVNIRIKQIVETHDLGGQPDTVAMSPNGRYAAVVRAVVGSN